MCIYPYHCRDDHNITTPLTVETLLSVTTRSRQIEKRLFLGMTFTTSSFISRLSRLYRVYLVYIAFVRDRLVYILAFISRLYRDAPKYI